jgi:hypothetical protein
MSAVDPTLKSMQRFRDPSQWDSIEQNVPIFIKHTTTEKIKDKDGKEHDEEIVVDEDRLKRIAANIQKNWEKNGVPICFTEGHTQDPTKVGQNQQPAILSYGINAHVGTWGPEKKLGVLVDQYTPKGNLDTVRLYPFRSAEFYRQTDEITRAALLRTDPRLDMGAVFYSRSLPLVRQDAAGQLFTCYMENTMADPTMPPAIAPPTSAEGDPNAGKVPEEFRKHADMYLDEKYPNLGKMHAEACEKYGAMTAPSGTNTTAAPPPVDGKKDDPVPFQRNGSATHYQGNDPQIKALFELEAKRDKELADLRTTIVRGELAMQYQRELTSILQEAGKHTDEAEVKRHVDFCLNLATKDDVTHYMNIVRDASERVAPIGGRLIDTNGVTPYARTKKDTIDQKTADEITLYMKKNGYVGEGAFAKATTEYMAGKR